jgi:hypothetical protein
MIGGVAPSTYLDKLQKHDQVKIDDVAMDAILRTHAIEPELLRRDDFKSFYAARKQALLALVGQAMGKTIQSVDPVLNMESEEGEEEVQEA